MVTVNIDYARLTSAMAKMPGLRNAINEFEQEVFFFAKANLITEIGKTKVAAELNEAEDAHNTTNTLRNTNEDQGNLFSFIGFDSGSDPVGDLTDMLEDKIQFSPANEIFPSTKNLLRIYFTPQLPSEEDYVTAAPFRWLVGRSWALDIEKSISGINSYLFRRGKIMAASHSGPAVQAKNKKTGELQILNPNASFKGIKFLTPIFRKFARLLAGRASDKDAY